MSHLDGHELERLALGELDDTARTRALAHVRRCGRCAAIYRALLALDHHAREAGLLGPSKPSR